jgi:hypothetical protein
MKKTLLTTAIISLIISAVSATGHEPNNNDLSDVSEAKIEAIAEVEGREFHKDRPGLDLSNTYNSSQKFGSLHHLRGYMLDVYSRGFTNAYLLLELQ